MSAKKTLTQWFSIVDDGEPVHVGLYDVSYADAFSILLGVDYIASLWWDGKFWYECKGGNVTEFGNCRTRGERWRGLAVNPKS